MADSRPSPSDPRDSESPQSNAEADAPVVVVETSPWRSEDVWAIWLGGALLLIALAATWFSRPADLDAQMTAYDEVGEKLQAAEAAPPPAAAESASDEEHKAAEAARVEHEKALADLRKQRDKARDHLAINPLKPYVAKFSAWASDPRKAFVDKQGKGLGLGVVGAFVVVLVLLNVGMLGMRQWSPGAIVALPIVFGLAVLSFVLAQQKVINDLNLEYALWALVVGLVISNTVGTPDFLRPAIRTEFYIKIGLVLLGAEVLFDRLLALGAPGVFTSWIVTPIVLIGTYIFGQRVLKIPSRSLNMVICADMSVCGVSAAIATAAACRAKKEELSLAIGLSLAFTVVMMVLMPPIIGWMGLGDVVGGAWIGGTIDSTGAVAAAGGMLGPNALTVAVAVKMIQNILIGFVAFGVAVYWVAVVEPAGNASKPSAGEIWRRFPKFVLGFVAASLVFTFISLGGLEEQATSDAVVAGFTKPIRNWLFCLAFVSIGLETNFRELSRFLVGGKPLVLYVCGQALNLALSLLMCWLMFEKVFPDAAKSLGK